MQALMLAAGMGQRLGKYTRDISKCMVEVAGKTILMRTVSALEKAGIHKFIIVAGYERERLKSYITEEITDMDIVFINNEDYESTNNIYSLYLARNFLIEDDTILLESDLVFDESLISDLVQCAYADAAVVAQYKPWMEGTMTLLDNENSIVDFIEKPDFSFSHTIDYYKTVNIYKFSQAFSADYFLPWLEADIKADGHNQYYEHVLKAIANLADSGLKAFKLADQKWYEIDDAQDLNIANTLFANEDEELSLYQKRYGGFWRFPDLHDFSTLVNPYFPPQNMLDKMKYSFAELLLQYPSGLQVQSINAGCMFDIAEDEIIVGNGAAELIHALKSVATGKIALTVPGFEEYVRCFGHAELLKIQTPKNNYTLKKDDFMEALDLANMLIIVNPDNPSGSFLAYHDLMEIIEKSHAQQKRIIVDESFIDFAAEEYRFTLINSDLLQKYKNLIVVKSLSKSYGITGLRLGVLACADQKVMEAVKNNLPIWNINSLAEYFLQIAPHYHAEYLASCQQLARQRELFAENLAQLDFLRVYPSQANFFLCELKPPLQATKMTAQLLQNHRILIKDLSSKEGFKNKQFIRIAVKEAGDNQLLFEALRTEAQRILNPGAR